MDIAVPDIPTLVSALAFLTILLFFVGVFQYSRQRAEKRETIQTIRRGGKKREADEAKSPSREKGGVVGPVLIFLKS